MSAEQIDKLDQAYVDGVLERDEYIEKLGMIGAVPKWERGPELPTSSPEIPAERATSNRTWFWIGIAVLLTIGVCFNDSQGGPVENNFTEIPTRTTQPVSLNSEFELRQTTCSPDGAQGTLRNTRDETVTIWVSTQFTRSDGTLVESGIDIVPDVRPGQTAEWSTLAIDEDFDRCRSEIDLIS